MAAVSRGIKVLLDKNTSNSVKLCERRPGYSETPEALGIFSCLPI